MALHVSGVPSEVALPSPRASSSPPAATRRHELDWLRALAVLGLIPFHAAVIFTTGSGDYIKSAQTSVSMDLLASFISLWGIQLLFFIGGAAAFFALHRRSSRQYVSERFTRLAIPFGFGVLTIVPLQIYVGYLATPGPHLSFWEYYGTVYLPRWLGILHGTIPANGDTWVGHLWFIPPLILFSLLALPVYRLSGRLTPQLKKRGAEICSGWRTLLLFGLPLGLIAALLHGNSPKSLSLDYLLSENWAEFISFLLFFFYGYIIYSNTHTILSARRYAWVALALGTVCWLVSEGLILGHLAPSNDFTLGYVLFMILRGYISWFWVIGITGLAIRYLGSTNQLKEYLNQSTYPVYVLHMLVLTTIAYIILRLDFMDFSLMGEFLTIVFLTLAATMLIYDLLVRRIGILRFLFGLHTATTKPAPRSPGVVAVLVNTVRDCRHRS